MTTTTPPSTAGYRAFLGRLDPALAKANHLADIEQRMAKAWDYWLEAVAADDGEKAQRAMERYYLRLEQWEWLAFRAPDAVCGHCQPGPVVEGVPYSACLDHAAAALAEAARERMAR